MAAQGMLVVCLLVPGLAIAANKPAASTPTAAQPAAPAQTDPTNGVGEFVPLTHLPQIQSLSQSQNFGTFVNTFYRILIGVGAVLAVLMIMYAGVQFMTSQGSVTSNEKAKSRIQNAIFGLILVLAPTIVFGIINPDILHLNLGTEFVKLKQDKGVDQSAFQSNVVGSTTANSTYLLAYYYTRRNTSTNYMCYGGTVNSFTTQQACETSKNNLPITIGAPDPQATRSPITYVKSCELGDASTVNLNPPSGLPRCPN